MLKFISRIAPVVVMALVAVGFAHFVRADDATQPTTEPAASTGSIVVTVNTEDGKPAVGADVKLFAAHSHAKKPKSEAADDGSSAGTDAPKKKPMGKPLQSGTTDDKGMYTFTDVPFGSYTVMANLEDSGRGKEKVTLSSDSESVTITLKAPEPKPDAGSSSQPAPSN